jgi:Rrf2 family protein
MSKTIQISEGVSLALHSMALITEASEILNAGQLAESTGFSKNHLAKILQRLVKEDLVNSNRGPSGGFTLAKHPKDITLLAIYEAIEGKLSITHCPLHNQKCPLKACLFGGLLHRISLEFFDYMQKTTLQSLSKGAQSETKNH